MAGTVALTKNGRLSTLRLSRDHGNAINPALVDDVSRALAEARDDDGVGGVMLAAEGKLFCPGLDLQELVELDRQTMAGFLERFAAFVLALHSFPKPMVAALHGHAIAGGCVLALTADWRVLAENALIGLAEIRVGLPLPFGVALVLRDSVPRPRLEEIALLGRNYRGKEALDAGLVHEVRPVAGFEAACRERLAEFAEKDGRAFAVTKRYLRSAAIDRIRADEARHHDEFLDCWFQPETRARVRGIVAELRQGR